MSKDPRKRQKHLEKRAAKRKSKQQLLVRVKSAGLPERLLRAAEYPIVDCLVSDSLWDDGLGWVVLSRQLPNGSIAFAMFLVDRYCLGVKNVTADITSRFDYDSRIAHKMRHRLGARPMSPAAARSLVEQAVAYAHSWGLAPHPDYHRAGLLFGNIDAAECREQFEFGKDGKPFFIAGPNDDQARCRHILATLAEHGGPDGFHYLMPGGKAVGILADSTAETLDPLIDDQEAEEP